MEPNVGKTQVYFSSNPWFKRKLFWVIFTLVMILIPVGAYLYGIYFIKPTTPSALPPPAAKNTLEENSSPITFDILKNPLVYEWRGSVEGTLTAKDERSMTLNDKDNNKITIRIIASSQGTISTKFYKSEAQPDKDGGKFKEVTIDNIPLGTKLHGDFFVFPHKNNELIGSSFNIVE